MPVCGRAGSIPAGRVRRTRALDDPPADPGGAQCHQGQARARRRVMSARPARWAGISGRPGPHKLARARQELARTAGPHEYPATIRWCRSTALPALPWRSHAVFTQSAVNTPEAFFGLPPTAAFALQFRVWGQAPWANMLVY